MLHCLSFPVTASDFLYSLTALNNNGIVYRHIP